MLLSYCYVFTNSRSPTVESQPPPHSSRDRRSSTSDPRCDPSWPSLSSFEDHTRPDASILSQITDWSCNVASSIRSSVPSSFPSLFDSESPDSYLTRAYSKLHLPSVTSWFAPPSSDSHAPAQAQAQAPVRSVAIPPRTQQSPHSADPTEGRTTFTFVLFGAASTAAVYLLVRNRRTMNRLQTAKGLAYRDARAWRRVALDFAKINALAASRVQNLVASSLREGHAGSEIGRQIEKELEEATRAVAQRRNWIREQDSKDAEASSSDGQRGFAEAWDDVFDLDRTGFFFGSRAGRRGSDLGEYGRWQPKHFSRHDDVSSGSSNGLAFKASEAWTRCKPARSEDAGATLAQKERSAKDKWQRVAGLSATSSSEPATAAVDSKSQYSAVKDGSKKANADQQTEVREEWIGDVASALRERDLKSSQSKRGTDQAAVDAFSRDESEEIVEAITGFTSGNKEGQVVKAAEDEDHLLPVSDLHIATGGRLRDEPSQATDHVKLVRSARKAKMSPTQVKTTVSSTDKFSYPISDQFRDLEDIVMASWDDSYAGLSQTIAADLAQSAKPAKEQKSKAGPNSALFDKLRSQRSKTPDAPKKESEEITEIMAGYMFGRVIPQTEESVVPAKTASPAPEAPAAVTSPAPVASDAKVQELVERLETKEADLIGHKQKINALSERLDSMREMCHDLTDEAQKRDKMHRIQIEQLEQKVGLFTVWAEEVQRRMGLETPPFFASIRKPIKRD